MPEITVELGERSYPILIAPEIMNQVGSLILSRAGLRKALLVSNPTVFDLYGQNTVDRLKEAGFSIETALMPDGEEYKNLYQAGAILDRIVESGLERDSIIIALGGGVVGDLGGFTAAVYQRGIDYIQIPTTLLSQVDSSVGGKVAVNHPGGKNLIGAFHQPRMVLIDPGTLDTLDDREYKSGLGEVVKYGIIYDKDFFSFMELNAERIKQRDKDCLSEIIYRSCRIKSEIVNQDEKETGIRSILNLGHTFGHSIEKLGGYSRFRHGEAVILGTVCAAQLGILTGTITEEEVQRIMDLFEILGIYGGFPEYSKENIYNGMLNDKKVKEGKLAIILPKGIGSYLIAWDIERDLVLKAIEMAGSCRRFAKQSSEI